MDFRYFWPNDWALLLSALQLIACPSSVVSRADSLPRLREGCDMGSRGNRRSGCASQRKPFFFSVPSYIWCVCAAPLGLRYSSIGKRRCRLYGYLDGRELLSYVYIATERARFCYQGVVK